MTTSASAHADTVRRFEGSHCNGWFFPACLSTQARHGEVRFGNDSYEVTADVELLYTQDATYGYLEHWSREYGGGRSEIRRTSYIRPGEDDPSDGKFRRVYGLVFGTGYFSPTHGKSVVIRFCVAGNAVGGKCGGEIEILENPQ
ncbi:hypothetical protein ABT247_00275 [Kitasatospora sp. NPDC001539]|uniref:hypothetical protein n=1 Tax=Kitasatospora sp. NPDC001539 TaxID=3154384 RepID=UPI003333E552